MKPRSATLYIPQQDAPAKPMTFASIERKDDPQRTTIQVGGRQHVVHLREKTSYIAKGKFLPDALPLIEQLLLSTAILYSPEKKGEPLEMIPDRTLLTYPSQADQLTEVEVHFHSPRIADHYHTHDTSSTILPPNDDIFVPPPPRPDPIEPPFIETERTFDNTFDNTFN